MRVSFYGACREVTGSNILVEAAGKKILLDCGLFQGTRLSEERNFAPFLFGASAIDSVIISHAHLDHTGRLPKLFKEGFRGKIYSTGPTCELTNLVLEDCEKLMREEAERDKHNPLYSKQDIASVMQLFETVGYGERVEITENVWLTFKNAGHILGSAITLIESDGLKLGYSGDLGNNPSILLKSPDYIEDCDFLICESTYGGQVHEDAGKRHQKLAQIISATIAQSGILMIPSFAIEKTQELLHDIEDFCSVQNCQKPTFFLDSPLAFKVTEVFRKYSDYLNLKIREFHKDGDFFGLERLKITSSVEESKAIDQAPNPKVIIAGSGMMNGGRILHHMKKYLGDTRNTLLIVGYQSTGTLGRRIFEGEKEVNIHGQKVLINAQIKTIGSYSAHADLPQIINWLSKTGSLKKVFVVHGESDQAVALSKSIEQSLKIATTIPQQGQDYNLN